MHKPVSDVASDDRSYCDAECEHCCVWIRTDPGHVPSVSADRDDQHREVAERAGHHLVRTAVLGWWIALLLDPIRDGQHVQYEP